MNIVNQTNYNECGVCVVKSLVDHFHHKNINYDEILNKANVNSEGLNIYDLELLGSKYGLLLESYECDIDELFTLKNKEYFVVMINNNNLNHYVIARILNKQNIEIYCSINGIYQLTKEEFKEIWTNIYIKVSKSIANLEIKSIKKIDWNLINWKNFTILNFINIFIVILSIIGSLFSEKIINLVINNNELKYLLTIVVSFLLIFIVQALLNYFLNIFCFKKNYDFFRILHQKTILILNKKNLNFFNKVDFGYILGIEQYLYQFSNFYNFRLNQIIADSLLLIFIICAFSFIHYLFVIIIIILLLCTFIINIIKIKINNDELYYLESLEAKHHQTYLKFLTFIKSNKFHLYNQNFINEISNNFANIKNKAKKMYLNTNNINLINEIFSIIFYILNFVISSILIINKHLSLSQLFFVISLMQLVNKSSKNLSSLFYDFKTLNISKKIIYNIWNIENNSLNEGLKMNIINNIKYQNINFNNDTLLIANNGYGKSTILKSIALMHNTKASVLINDLNLNVYDSNELDNKIIYLSDEFIFNKNEIIKLFKSEFANQIAEIISNLKLNNLDSNLMSLGQIQILNFLSLINLNNKIILLDECLNHVDKITKYYLLTQIKPLIINNNNFIIMVDHDIKQENNLFKNYVYLNEKIF